MRRLLASLSWVVIAAAPVFAQNAASPPQPMPTNRAYDSYRIYSSLLPFGETALPAWPHEVFLVEDVTVSAVPPDQPCKPATADQTDMNPHIAVHPTEDRKQDFAEILADFDAHCHDRIALNAESFNTIVPLRLLTPADQQEFRMAHGGLLTHADPAAIAAAQEKYNGASALFAFSEVYFNQRQTVALVYATHWCGSLCGQGMWLAFALENGQWKPLRWSATSWIS